MTRPIDATLLTHIQNDTVLFPFLAVHLSTASGDFYFKTNSGNITFGGHTYLGDGSLLSIQALVENRDLSQSALQVVFSGLNLSLLNALKANNSSNYPVTIYVGLQDQNNALIGSPIALGPFLLLEPVIEVDSSSYRMTATVEYYTSLLQRSNGLLFTDQAQQNRHAGDLFFHLLPILQQFQMLWGQQSIANGVSSQQGVKAGGGTGGGGGAGGGRGVGGLTRNR